MRFTRPGALATTSGARPNREAKCARTARLYTLGVGRGADYGRDMSPASNPGRPPQRGEDRMAERVYKGIELVGTSTESWEKAATAAVSRASKSLRDLRIAEVSELDMQLEGGKVLAYRAKVKVSFKYEGGKD